MKIKKVLVTTCTAGLVMSTMSGCSILPKEEVFRTTALVKEYEEEEFNMTTVKRGDISNYKKINCEFRMSNIENVEVEPWVTIKKLNVKVGDKVKAGDVLVILESNEVDSDIDELKYQINIKKTQIEQAKRMCELKLERQKLVLDDETSMLAIEESCDAEISRYEGEIGVLEAQLASQEEEKKRYQITASFDGTVTYVNDSRINGNFQPHWGGGRGNNSDDSRVVTISDGSMPYFVAQIDSSEYIQELEEGQIITIDDVAEEYEAKVHFPKKDKDYVYFLMEYVPENISNGDNADALYVIEERKDVLYLPDSALYKMGDSYIVYYEDENGLKNAKEVQIGLQAENKVEIVSGLEFGDAVIVR